MDAIDYYNNKRDQRIEFIEKMDSAFNQEISIYLECIQEDIQHIRNIVMHYNDEYCLDFSDEATELIRDIKC